MESSTNSLGLQYHVRSISLPSRLHPTATKIESEISKLRASLISTSSHVSPDTIQNGLVGLAELYNCVEELIQSPNTQQAFVQHRNAALLEDTLEGSIGLLDSCGTLTGLLTLMKKNVQDLQSALRRRGGDSSVESHISAYFCSRKQAKKSIAKCLKSLKQMDSKSTGSYPLLDADQHLSLVVRVLREVSGITICVFQSLLLFLSAPCSAKRAGWSLISSLKMKNSTGSCEENQNNVNEVEIVDITLRSSHGKVDVQMAHSRLQKLDARIENFEAGLDSLFRRLIQSRTSLLNTLAN